MDYKKEIQKLLILLKANGYGRRKIEADFEYSAKSIDQILAKGGNSRFLALLKIYCRAVLPKTIYNEESPIQPIKAERAGKIEKNDTGGINSGTSPGDLQALSGLVAELLRRDIRREAGGNLEKEKEIRRDILRRIGPKLSSDLKKGIGVDGDT